MLSSSLIRRALRPALTGALCALLLAAHSLSAADAEDAKPFLHPLFTSNMVLQRGVADPIWGWTTPGQTVTVTTAPSDSSAVRGVDIQVSDGKVAKAVAGPDGRWTAKIGPLAVGKTYTITVSGPQTVTLDNVLVGDVWLCSGQSNMEFGLGNTLNAAAETAAADYPEIRLLMVDNKTSLLPQQTFTGGPWTVCSPATVRQGGWNGFSAVGYFFGRDLSRNLHVPIGLIEADWGGTPAQAWVSTEALGTMPPPNFTAQIAAAQNPSRYPSLMEAWYAKHDAGAASKSWAASDYDASAWKTMTLPTAWESVGIPEMASFDGVVWFRKEFTLPATWAGRDAVLHLGPIDDRDTTYVNGVKVGNVDQYDVPRDYKIAGPLLKPGKNVITVRVLDTGGGGGLDGKPAQMSLEASGETALPLAGRWSYQIAGPLPADDPVPPVPGGDQNAPAMLYNAMIAPLVPDAIKGVIWYQGEANVGAGKQYQTLLPTLIGDWRRHFAVGDFPFLIVQLANYGPRQTHPEESSWAEVQDAQRLTSAQVPKTGLAVTLDLGDANDIHPKNKQEVGRRLALVARAVAYGQNVEYSGPVYQGFSVEGSKIRLRFTHLGGGLVAKDGPLEGFAIAGADGKFAWGNATIDGDTVVVSAPSVPSPTDVRYAWDGNPLGNLLNKTGLPASLFRTGK